MKNFMKKGFAVLSLGFVSMAQVFADSKNVKINIGTEMDDSASKGLSLGLKILIGIVAVSVVFGAAKGMIAYSTARDQEKKQILASTITSAVIALIVMLVIFGIVALFLKTMGFGDVITF